MKYVFQKRNRGGFSSTHAYVFDADNRQIVNALMVEAAALIREGGTAEFFPCEDQNMELDIEDMLDILRM